MGAGQGTLVSRLLSPSVPGVGLEAPGAGALRVWKGSYLELGKGVPLGEQGLGRWQVAGRSGATVGSSALPLSRVSWRPVTLFLSQPEAGWEPLHSSPPGGCGGVPGTLGAEIAAPGAPPTHS